MRITSRFGLRATSHPFSAVAVAAAPCRPVTARDSSAATASEHVQQKRQSKSKGHGRGGSEQTFLPVAPLQEFERQEPQPPRHVRGKQHDEPDLGGFYE